MDTVGILLHSLIAFLNVVTVWFTLQNRNAIKTLERSQEPVPWEQEDWLNQPRKPRKGLERDSGLIE